MNDIKARWLVNNVMDPLIVQYIQSDALANPLSSHHSIVFLIVVKALVGVAIDCARLVVV